MTGNGAAMPSDDRFDGVPDGFDESRDERTTSYVRKSESATLAPFISIDDLFAPQPEAAFLVRALGIAPGAATGIFGQGYVGKTIVGQDLIMSVALGERLWGLYETRRGRCIHFDHEQGQRVTAMRYQRLAKTREVWKEDLRDWLDVAIYPRLNLTTKDAEDHYARLFDGHAMALIDALKGVTPGIDENSSEIRDYMGILSRAAERTGCAAVLLHHAGKTAQGGERPRKESGRGSSAIFDECQSVFVLTAGKGEPIRVSHEKDRELGALLPDFGLRIDDVPVGEDRKGGLQVTHMDSEQMSQGKPNAIAALIARVLTIVKGNPNCSGRFVRSECKGARLTDVDLALEEAERKNLVQNAGTEKHAKWLITGQAL